jgi:CHASE2 domain-containing sensor protein
VPGVEGTFPTESAYNLIFVTAAAVSLASVAMALFVVGRKVSPMIPAGEPSKGAA